MATFDVFSELTSISLTFHLCSYPPPLLYLQQHIIRSGHMTLTPVILCMAAQIRPVGATGNKSCRWRRLSHIMLPVRTIYQHCLQRSYPYFRDSADEQGSTTH